MIYLECYADKTLVVALDIPKKEIRHSHGKGNVCKSLLKNGKSKGLVDEDPFSTQPSYLGKLEIKLNEEDIKLLYDESAQNHLVVLCPRLEDWILKAAKEAGVNVEDYNLPKDVDEFSKIINIKPERIVPLIQNIKKKKGKMLKTLEVLLKK